MIRIERLLVPLDGSAHAEAALAWLSLLPAGQVSLLRVCPGEGAAYDEAERYLDGVSARLGTDRQAFATRTVVGDPAEVIVAAAVDADLIVMSTHGAGGGGRLLFGSVADRVARHAPVPALLVRGGHAPVATAPVRRIVVPLDGSAAAERAVPYAAILAQRLDAPIELATIVEEREASILDDAVSPASMYLDGRGAALQEEGITVSKTLRPGTPADALLAMVGPGDLLVLTTHGHGAARRWQVGQVTEKLLRRATAPVVLVRADAP